MSCYKNGEHTSWEEAITEASELSEEWDRHADICTETPEQEALCRRIALHWASVVLHIEAGLENAGHYQEIRKSNPSEQKGE